MEKNFLLSVVVPVYNHEKYIVQALDSILMQKTNFDFEVLVGEDCSTDNSRKILQEYEKLHPDFLTVYYREKNMTQSKAKYCNTHDLKLKSKGKYLIILEGDDYWTDPHKLQKQVDFLESHPDYIAVAHNCTVVDENSEEKAEAYPECKEEEYTLRHYNAGVLPGQTATFMTRNYATDKNIRSDLLFQNLVPGDRLTYFTLITQGKIRCIQESMSAYRHVTGSGNSYSANFKYDFDHFVNYYNQMILYAEKMGRKDAIISARTLYLRNLRLGVKYKKISLMQAIKMWIKTRDKIKVLKLCFSAHRDRKRFYKEIQKISGKEVMS